MTTFDFLLTHSSVVFIHGLQGHPEKTWTSANHTLRKRSFRKSSTDLSAVSSDKAIFWPYDFLSKEDSLAHARILTWGYDTHVVTDVFGAADEQNISQHGNNLMVALQQERKRDVCVAVTLACSLLFPDLLTPSALSTYGICGTQSRRYSHQSGS